MADTLDSKSSVERHVGSTPTSATNGRLAQWLAQRFYTAKVLGSTPGFTTNFGCMME